MWLDVASDVGSVRRTLLIIAAYSKDSGDGGAPSGVTQYSLERHAQVASQYLSGLTDEIAVWGGESYSGSTTRYDFASGATAHVSQSGSQPRIGVTYRLIDQKDQSFNLDLSASVPGMLSIALSRQLKNFTIDGSSL